MQPLDAGEPRTIGAYRLLGRLGSGGMGRVYLARNEGGRTVAVKIVHPHFALDAQFRERFRREVEAARRVGGRWTAPVLDADPEAPVPWVATGYVAGPTLARAVEAVGPLPEHTVRTLGAGLAEALAGVHALGLVHRDVKPSNVLATLEGPRLIDFGIARAMDGTASLTASGVSIGSPGYMAPEQILGQSATGASDVFSLGAVLAYAAIGAPPFPGDTSATLLYKVVHEEPELGALAGELRELVAACLAKDPSDRPTPSALASALAPAGAAVLVSAGWLPTPLVEQISRTAVQLLELDAGTGGFGADPNASGPAPFTGSSVWEPAPEGPATGPPSGVFGPLAVLPPEDETEGASRFGPPGRPGPSTPSTPSTPLAPADQPGPFTAPAPPTPSDQPGRFTPPRPSTPPGPFTPPTPSAPADPPVPAGSPAPGSGVFGPPFSPVGPASGAPGLFGVPAAGQDTTAPGGEGPRRRQATLSLAAGRRVSCTVALAVAGALASVTLGAGYLFELLPGGGRGADAGRTGGNTAGPPADNEPTRTGTPSATPTRTPGRTPTPTSAPGSVPAGFLGTWTGPTTERNGSPHGDFTAVVTKGGAGEDVVRTTHSLSVLGTTVRCHGIGRLTAATSTELRIADRTDPDRPGTEGLCTGGTSSFTLTLGADGTLTYRSEEEAAGRPSGTLRKS
ncbi:protein kinase [Streptomyces sp. Je 1-79]|uniref:serine/threonine-protein kinase n=1 Tax=Streptomyces sp. Je 1-79 TaxID=2943847 RepID=UPI0021A74095|nr:serine/threonine-protein kinase [Streptomyces sp. Je 1-79]MCT4355952.1 protein kinase [Streptomyces sp. Je 1-79]